jgi:hypothetical protein
MKPPLRPLSPQLHLPLLDMPATVIPSDKHGELVLALVELLIGAAQANTLPTHDGGVDERETHR